jgi:hypothetical protein
LLFFFRATSGFCCNCVCNDSGFAVCWIDSNDECAEDEGCDAADSVVHTMAREICIADSDSSLI